MTPEESLAQRTWCSGDGRVTPVVELTDAHLQNLARWIDKKLGELEEELQQLAFEGESDPISLRITGNVCNRADYYAAWRAILVEEAARRGIDPTKKPRKNPGIELQSKWRWNGRPVCVKIARNGDAVRIEWLRWFPHDNNGSGGWRGWRAYVGYGRVWDVIRNYRSYAAEWRGLED